MPDSVDQILNRLQPGKFDATRAAKFDLEAARGSLPVDLGITRLLEFNEEERTAKFAFATDQPIEHWFGMLTLDVSKSAVDLSRVEAGVCPFLVNHNRNDQVGVVVPGSVELGPVIRGTVKFSRSARGEEILNDVKDEIRNGTSIGLLVQDMVLDNEKEVRKGAIPHYTATKWTMLENSVASIPADIACGAGRSFEKPTPSQESSQNDPASREIPLTGERNMPNTDPQTPETPVAAPPAATPVNDTVSRTREIVEFAEIFGEGDLARTMIASSNAVTVEDVRDAIKAKRSANPTPMPTPEAPESVALRQGGITPGQVQLARSLPRNRSLTTFKGENGVERAYRFGMWALGRAFYDPNAAICITAAKFCDENSLGSLTRAMSEGVNESGGYTVPPEFSNDIIDLREQYGVFRQHAKVVPMGSDTLSIPRRVSGLTAYFVSEAGSLTASDKAWDQVELVAKKMACLARYSTEVNEDSIVDFASDLADEIAFAFAEKEDQCGFNGDGTSTYGKIVGVRQSLLDINSVAGGAGLVLATGHNAYSELVLTEFESVVGALPQYADPNAKWFVHRSFYWNVMVKLLLASGGVTATEVENARKQIFMGYPVVFSQVMPSTEANSQVCALFGDLAKAAILGTRRDVSIMTSEHSRFANDQIEIKGTERFDIAVHGVGTSTVAGPIVGLLTAAS